MKDNVYSIKKELPIAEMSFLYALKNFDEEILNVLYNHSNDIIQLMLVEEICRIKGYNLENKLVA